MDQNQQFLTRILVQIDIIFEVLFMDFYLLEDTFSINLDTLDTSSEMVEFVGQPDSYSISEMAEAMMEESLPNTETKFFCHKCSLEIPRVLPDYTCPNCFSGFIEEIEPLQEDENDIDSGDESLGTTPDFVSLMMEGDMLNEPQRRHSTDGGGRFTMRQQRLPNHMPLENLIQDFILNITGLDWGQVGAIGATEGGRRVAPVSFFLGNPGDYAWGREGLDAIVTQLLNQMDGTGPPPLTKDKIQGIPTVQIAKEQVDQNLQCSVCWEDFTLGENVRKLPCEHVYHDICIIPWLELHGTCPICRKVLHEEGADEQGRAGAASTANSLPQSLAALFRVASGGGAGSPTTVQGTGSSTRESSQGSNSSSNSSTQGNSTNSTSTTTSSNSSTRRPPRDPHHFWDMDLEFD